MPEANRRSAAIEVLLTTANPCWARNPQPPALCKAFSYGRFFLFKTTTTQRDLIEFHSLHEVAVYSEYDRDKMFERIRRSTAANAD